MNNVQIEFVEAVKGDKDITNYDYKKFSVKDNNGKFVGFVYENNNSFINLKESMFYDTKEDAAKKLIKR